MSHPKLPEVAQTLQEEFGRAAKRARSLKGWTLDQVVTAMGGDPEANGKSFLSNVEKGKRSISPRTVGKLIKALDLPEAWIDRFLDDAPNDPDEVTSNDENADRLLRMAERDETLPPSAEGLLIGLAQSYAGGNYRDHFTAYTALKAALEVAQALREQGALPSNTDSQLGAVLREVARLNDQGDFQAAADLLDDEFSRASSALETVVQRQLDQDRILNRPKAAADRLIAQLKRHAPPEGVFRATRDLIWEWRQRGETQSLPFDLSVALALGRINQDRGKRPGAKADGIHDLAICQSLMGERSKNDKLLHAADANLRKYLRIVTRKKDPTSWSAGQNSLGNTLHAIGDRNRDIALLEAAIAAHGQALLERDREIRPQDWAASQTNLGVAKQTLGEVVRDPVQLHGAIEAHQQALLEWRRDLLPLRWASVQNNIGLARRWLGSLTCDLHQLDASRVAFKLCLEERHKDAEPFLWATTQWNLADLALARFELTADRSLLETARHHVFAAREVFVLGSDHQTAECDRLLARIDAA